MSLTYYFTFFILISGENEAWYSMWIICWQMIPMEYQASFFISKSIKIWKSHLLHILDVVLWVDIQIPVPILWETVINLTLSLPVQSADNLAPGSPLSHPTNPESELFDNLMVFLKEIFENVNFEKIISRHKKNCEKLPSVQRVDI